MTQTQTVTYPSGWTTAAYPQGDRFKIIAIAPDRKRAIHLDKQSAAQVAAMPDPATLWGDRIPAAKVDVMAQLSASIDAAKAARA
jgi:hypothetical protein